MNMKYLKEIKLANDDYQRYSKLDSIVNHHRLISSLSQGDFGDDSPKVPAI
jgi:hypothetical protein